MYSNISACIVLDSVEMNTVVYMYLSRRAEHSLGTWNPADDANLEYLTSLYEIDENGHS